MYHLLKSENIEIYLRFSAFAIILDVVGERLNAFERIGLYNKVSHLENMEDGSYVEEKSNAVIDWHSINTILEKYAPEECDSK